MLKCQPSQFGLLAEHCLFAVAGQTDEYVLFDIWQISTMTVEIDLVIYSFPFKLLFFLANLSSKLHTSVFVSVAACVELMHLFSLVHLEILLTCLLQKNSEILLKTQTLLYHSMKRSGAARFIICHQHLFSKGKFQYSTFIKFQ